MTVISSSWGEVVNLNFSFFAERGECSYPSKNIVRIKMGRSHGSEKGEPPKPPKTTTV